MPDTTILKEEQLSILIRGALAMAQRVCHARFCDAHPLGQAEACKVTTEAIGQLDALCQTVRALRARLAQMETAARNVLETCLDETDHNPSSGCLHDLAFVVAQKLGRTESALAAVTQERDELRQQREIENKAGNWGR